MKHLPFSNLFLKSKQNSGKKGHQPLCRHAIYGTVEDPDPIPRMQVVVQQAAADCSTGPEKASSPTLTSTDFAAAP